MQLRINMRHHICQLFCFFWSSSLLRSLFLLVLSHYLLFILEEHRYHLRLD